MASMKHLALGTGDRKNAIILLELLEDHTLSHDDLHRRTASAYGSFLMSNRFEGRVETAKIHIGYLKEDGLIGDREETNYIESITAHIRENCESPSLNLYYNLGRLEDGGLVKSREGVYELTRVGKSIAKTVLKANLDIIEHLSRNSQEKIAHPVTL